MIYEHLLNKVRNTILARWIVPMSMVVSIPVDTVFEPSQLKQYSKVRSCKFTEWFYLLD